LTIWNKSSLAKSEIVDWRPEGKLIYDLVIYD